MTSTTIEPTTRSSRRILSDEGLECSIIFVAPGEETNCSETPPLHDHLLFVIEGSASVTMEKVTCMLKRNDALRLPADREHHISAVGGSVRLLRVDFPPREKPAPPLYTFPDR
jgi:mannose-6-phosphate isomerase-like protein (cupin superfamily)